MMGWWAGEIEGEGEVEEREENGPKVRETLEDCLVILHAETMISRRDPLQESELLFEGLDSETIISYIAWTGALERVERQALPS